MIFNFKYTCIISPFILFFNNFICPTTDDVHFFFGCTLRHVELPRPGIEPAAPAVEAGSLNHWTTREVHHLLIYIETRSNLKYFLKMRFLKIWTYFSNFRLKNLHQVNITLMLEVFHNKIILKNVSVYHFHRNIQNLALWGEKKSILKKN